MSQLEENFLLLQEKFVSSLDFEFLLKIKKNLPFQNAYFLVCLVEVIYQAGDEGDLSDKLDQNTSFEDLLSYFNEKATSVYLNTNISEYLLAESEVNL